MALQNRVTPFGDIVAIPQRGLFVGNRGIIHDPATKTLLARRWASKAWLVCVLHYKGRRRDVMSSRSWTELFFLDEAIALAAGHRPCFFCRRVDAEAFRAAWAKAKGGRPPFAPELDAVLHAERLDQNRKRVHPLPGPVSDLPDGAVITAAGEAYMLARGMAFRWSEQGYGAAQPIPRADGLLTPPSTLLAIRAGYRPVLHPVVLRPAGDVQGNHAPDGTKNKVGGKADPASLAPLDTETAVRALLATKPANRKPSGR